MPLRRPTLASAAADQIREAIAKGEWGERLPGGRELARSLDISRPVVYQALRQLQAEGLLDGGRKAARQVRGAGASPRPPSPKVVFLSPYQVEDLEELPARLAPMLARSLADDGMRLEFVHVAQADRKVEGRALDNLTRLHHPRAWVLYRCSTETQSWFEGRGLPCLVLGSRPAGSALPGVDVDYAAAARHLAGRLGALGHRRESTWLLTPGQRLASHALTADALFGAEAPRPNVAELDADPDRMAGQIDAVLEQKPTALVTLRALHAEAVVARLWSKGLRCPADLSLVSLQDSASLSVLRPEISRYTLGQAKLFTAISRALGNVLRGGTAARAGKLLLPELTSGKTLGVSR